MKKPFFLFSFILIFGFLANATDSLALKWVTETYPKCAKKDEAAKLISDKNKSLQETLSKEDVCKEWSEECRLRVGRYLKVFFEENRNKYLKEIGFICVIAKIDMNDIYMRQTGESLFNEKARERDSKAEKHRR